MGWETPEKTKVWSMRTSEEDNRSFDGILRNIINRVPKQQVVIEVSKQVDNNLAFINVAELLVASRLTLKEFLSYFPESIRRRMLSLVFTGNAAITEKSARGTGNAVDKNACLSPLFASLPKLQDSTL